MEFPDLGAHCSNPSCNRLDFLPMRCDACRNNFCADHFRYEYHGCDGERKKDVQVPTCPLCNAPVPGKRGEQPDVAVSAHIDDECQADPAKKRRNKIFTNRCSLKGCKAKEMVPVICNECSLNFCFRHRHTEDHQCEGKMGAVRKRAMEAAMKRMDARETNGKSHNGKTPRDTPRTQTFAEVQGNMSEDEALARALALSMQEEDDQQTRRNPNLNRVHLNRQQVGGETNGRCIVS